MKPPMWINDHRQQCAHHHFSEVARPALVAGTLLLAIAATTGASALRNGRDQRLAILATDTFTGKLFEPARSGNSRMSEVDSPRRSHLEFGVNVFAKLTEKTDPRSTDDASWI